MAVIAIFATAKLFCCQKIAARPFSVTFIWIVIDLAIITYLSAVMTTIDLVKHNEAAKMNWVYWTGYECYYASIALNVVYHWAFAMEYLRTVIKLPIIMDIFSNSTEKKLRQERFLIVSLNCIYYSSIILWFILNNFELAGFNYLRPIVSLF